MATIPVVIAGINRTPAAHRKERHDQHQAHHEGSYRKVLTGQRKPMTVAQITEAALPLTNLKGATPKQVFYSVLYGENKKPNGLVVKAGEGGTFRLNPKRAKAAR